MKKIFSFAVALFATIAVSAQTYDLSTMNITEADITVTNGTKTADSKYVVVKNTAGETVNMTIAQLPNIVFAYKNSEEKTAYKVYPNKIQADGNQRDIIFNNVTPGTTITLTVGSKGSTGAAFVDGDKGTAFTGCIFQSGTTTFEPKVSGQETEYADLTVMATGTTVTIRETAGGYVLTKVVIGGSTGSALEDATVEAEKAQKVIENGVIYIIKNGVKYNVLGAVVK